MKERITLGDIFLLHTEERDHKDHHQSKKSKVIGYVLEVREDSLILDSYDPRAYRPSKHAGKEVPILYSEIKSYEKIA